MRVEILPADAACWSIVQPMLAAIWPLEVVAGLPWRDVAWAPADRRVLVWDVTDELVGHVGIQGRDGTWNGRRVRIGGIGGVATRPQDRRRGTASRAMQAAAHEIQSAVAADFGLLFCEPRHFGFYERLGWRSFGGEVFADQPQGRIRFDVTAPLVLDLALAPRTGVLDLCGFPW